MSKKIPLDTIPFEADIKIVMPGAFYARLQQLLYYISSQCSQAELLKTLALLKEKKDPENEIGYHIHTLTVMVHEIERKAKEQGVIVVKEIELDENGNVKEPPPTES